MLDAIDVLSSTGLRTGEILSRAEVHRRGKYHRAVHIYILNSHGDILLQRRSSHVDHFPEMYSISVTGHVNAGEGSSHCAKREIEEELGLSVAEIEVEFLFSFFQEATLSRLYIDRQFNDVYLVHADIDPLQINVDEAEVEEARFVTFEDFRDMIINDSHELAPVYKNECQDLVYFLAHINEQSR